MAFRDARDGEEDEAAMLLLGVDVGGTFTDVVYTDTEAGTVEIHKVPTTPEDPSKAAVAGIEDICRRFGVAPAEIDHVLHGTTVATNAVLEYDGAEAGMVTTEGYRDILHIGRHQRPQNYSIRQQIPWQDRPLIRRRHRHTVPERLRPPRGEVETPLDEEAVRRAARALKTAGVRSVAVCFLFSYLNDAHEARAHEIILEEHPDCFVTTSASVATQFREFERFTTTAMNAFIGPRVRDYVERIGQDLSRVGVGADLHVMCSNGGVATVQMVAERPVITLLSGPAGGVIGGAWSGAALARRNLITFDMGGTSADIGIVADGVFAEASARDTWIAGYPLLVPMLDIHTIGAGGGSIAHVDSGGAFQVGPESAGAVPGPAAYGRGGDKPTVTDANVVLGRLDPEFFLGGEMSLDVAAAERAIGGLADTLGLEPAAAAEGVLTIVTANMANAIHSRTVQKGIDPRQFALVAFGGAGPLHAVQVALALGVEEVIVPRFPGITSAVGLLTTDLKYDAIRTTFQTSGDLDTARLDADLAAMERELSERFAADGIDAVEVAFERFGDLRYVGQGYELRVAVPPGSLSEAVTQEVLDAFQAQHETEYGHAFPESPIEIVNLRCVGVGRMPKITHFRVDGGAATEEALIKRGRCRFRAAGKMEDFETPFYARERLPIGDEIAGPAIIVQKDSTTVVPPGSGARADASGNLIVRIGEEA
ncbi:MAG: hydantoinase/oxoprolinase family protein [Alphaproteobacteria bacterium]|jgi:N-methylhydantoinase A/oxoprolinase/acetone carboxylase beta subunit|nr:hydantoinase/oxoprolinase family protein [Alphaproteobacteria bacterium]